MPTRQEKLRAHAEHLLDLFIGLRERYALLRPMIFDSDSIRAPKKGPGRRGFLILKTSLFASCLLDIAKISDDSDKRTPNVRRLVDVLSEPALKAAVRKGFIGKSFGPRGHNHHEVVAELRELARADDNDRGDQFDHHVADLESRWRAFRASQDLASIRLMRHKLLAHSELHHDGKSYRPLDVRTLGLKWTALDGLVLELQQLVELAGLVFRNASFAFDLLDEQLNTAASAFWTYQP